jgi:uncharacterized protein DUF5615
MIKYLVDEHLSPEIAIQGRDKGLDIEHVNEIGLDDTDDVEIWEYCLEHNICMVSVDLRFRKRAENTIVGGIVTPGFFAVAQHLKFKNTMGKILDLLVVYAEAADYEADVKNQVIWVN